MEKETIMLKFVVDKELVDQPVTKTAAWNLMMDLLEIFELPMPSQRSEQADHLKVLVD